MASGMQSDNGSMGHREFIALMALITSAAALSIDSVLPALGAIDADLGAGDDNSRQLVVGIFFLGLAFSNLLFGPLSDSLGRKPVMFAGLILFAIGCIMSIWAPSFDFLLAGRVVQGIGAGGPRVVSIAVIRDRFEGRTMARTMSLIMTVFIVVPVFAPMGGQVLVLWAGWKALFWFFLAMGATMALWIATRLPETLAPAHRHPLSFNRVYMAFREIVTHRTTMGYLVAIGFVFAGFVGYLTSAQQIFQELYGLGEAFPVMFGLLASTTGLASYANSRLVTRFGMRKLARFSLLLQFGLGSILVAVVFVHNGVPPFWLACAVMAPLFFFTGTLFGNLNALAMQPMGHIAGSAAAVIGFATTTMSSTLGSMTGQAYNGTMFPLSLGFAVFGGLSLVMFLWAGKAGGAQPPAEKETA